MSLNKKILLVILPLVVLPLCTLGGLLSQRLYRTTKDSLLTETARTLDGLARTMEMEARMGEANLDLLSGSNILLKYAVMMDQDEKYSLFHQPLLRIFSNYQKVFPHYREIRFISPDGYEDARTVLGNIGNARVDESSSEFFRRLAEGRDTRSTLFTASEDTGAPSLIMCKRIDRSDRSQSDDSSAETFRGVLSITIDLSALAQDISRHTISRNGVIFLCDNSGTILVHPYPELMHRTFPMSSLKQGGTVTVHLPEYGYDGYFQSRILPGGAILLGYVPRWDILLSSLEINSTTGAVTVCTVLIASLVLFFSLRTILLRPLELLTQAVVRIGQGDMEVRPDIKSSDELGLLAESFRAMAANLKRYGERLTFMARHDALTCLPNRHTMDEVLDSVIARMRLDGGQAMLLFIDLDDLKLVNDTFGHATGDELIKQAASRLKGCLRPGDLMLLADAGHEICLSRLGGDEFLALVTGIDALPLAEKIAKRILDSLTTPFGIWGNTICTSASIGIAFFPSDGPTAKELVRNADLAMYEAKRQGKKTFRFYGPAMQEKMDLSLTILSRLRQAMEKEELMLHYQPILKVGSSAVAGYEALLRWHDAEFGWVPPSDFIPVAEQGGLILSLTSWVVREACRQCASWKAAGRADLYVSINMPGSLIDNDAIVGVVETALKDCQLQPDRLVIELTENTFIAWGFRANDNISSLRALGVQISIDDFGKEYSSLGYLTRFCVDCIKIDKSFIAQVPHDSTSAMVVKAIISLAHELGMAVVAEGVELKVQLDFLRELRCDLAQGYLLGRPGPPEQIPATSAHSECKLLGNDAALEAEGVADPANSVAA